MQGMEAGEVLGMQSATGLNIVTGPGLSIVAGTGPLLGIVTGSGHEWKTGQRLSCEIQPGLSMGSGPSFLCCQGFMTKRPTRSGLDMDMGPGLGIKARLSYNYVLSL